MLPILIFKVQISYGAHEKCDSEQEHCSVQAECWELSGRRKQPYKEQSLFLGEHRSFALRHPGKESQKESEQAALYFANGWAWNSRKQENLSYSLDSEKKWPGDLWHLRPPCLSPRPSALTSYHSNILKPGPAQDRTANDLDGSNEAWINIYWATVLQGVV